MSFSTVAQQDKLQVRAAPYWHRLAAGQHLGLRKSPTSRTWLVRSYDTANQRQSKHSLGEFSHLAANERFSAAAKAAREWLDHISAGGRAEEITVGEACARYIDHIALKKGDVQSQDAAARIRRYVTDTPLNAIPIQKLRSHHLNEWRSGLSRQPALVSRHHREKKTTRVRSPASVNRDMNVLRAALNLALADGFVLSAVPWRRALAPLPAYGRRALYLDREQRRALIEQLPDDLRPFVATLAVLPLRPGSLAALTVTSFDAKQRTLHIGHDKTGQGRTIPLPAVTAQLVAKAARKKEPDEPLFARTNGKAWNKDDWKRPLKTAALAAGLPGGTVAYSLRHAAITDLVSSGLDLFTIAQLSGTSVAMIEKHYGHLQRERARDALAGLSL